MILNYINVIHYFNSCYFQGNGLAPLQPQEVTDASSRIAFLALTDTKDRPVQFSNGTSHRNRINMLSNKAGITPPESFIYYDAVGPETMTILDMLRIFAKAQGNDSFRPVYIGYRNMEKLLNVRSLGNLNRQFVSLLRSEQDADKPIIGESAVWESLLGSDAKLQRIQHALLELNQDELQRNGKRRFPYLSILELIYKSPKIIFPGTKLSLEIVDAFITSRLWDFHESYKLFNSRK